MNFLNPILLPLLLLALLPVIIHLLNRLRYRTVKWAAMMFLLSANKTSTRQAKLRQYLILASRVALLFFFLFALTRPVVGGWLGMQMAGAPDTILILLDRSASMEAKDPRVQKSKREHAIDLFADAAAKSGAGSRYVLIENVLKTPQEIKGPESLVDYVLAAPTDTAADLPGMLRAARNYLVDNPEGRSEIWIASDLQESNWQPQSREWARVTAELEGLPQRVQIRLLALTDGYLENRDIRLLAVDRGDEGVDLSVAIRTAAIETEAVPVVFTLNGARSQVELDLDMREFRFGKQLPLATSDDDKGWGTVSLAADENLRDNEAYFVYAETRTLNNTVIAADDASGRLLLLAVAADGNKRAAARVAEAEATSIDWDVQSLVVWQGGAPQSVVATPMQRFVENGGVVLCLPPTGPGANGPFGLSWSTTERAGENEPFRITEWEENDGPLARSQNGKNLPVDELAVRQRRVPVFVDASGANVAAFDDGQGALVRKQMGDGWVYALATLPHSAWSGLVQGTVLVPMVQRMIAEGSVGQTRVAQRYVGEWNPEGQNDEAWVSLDAPEQKNPQWDAGVYASGSARIALNRPVAEDDPAVLERAQLAELFGDLPVQIMQEAAATNRDSLSSEIWKLFVCLALVFMIAESLLVLSGIKKKGAVDHGFKKKERAAA